MSAAQYIEITCDHCKRVEYEQTSSVRQARAELASALGPWVFRGGRDLCPDCKTK